MEPLIAVIGSVQPSRSESIGLRSAEAGERAAEGIGRALARQKCRIVAYSAADFSVERLVVRGYVDECKTNADLKDFAQGLSRIEVPYSQYEDQPEFPERKEVHEQFFYYRGDRSQNWASSFYRSLGHIDGAILIGGSHTTYVAGTVALSHRKPIAPIATFGGEAAKLWRELTPEPNLLEEREVSLLNSPAWEPRTLDTLVKNVLEQQRRISIQLQEAQKVSQQRAGLQHVYVAVPFLVAALGIMPFTWDNADLQPRVLLFLLLLGPLLAGVSGATARTAFESIGGILSQVPMNLSRTCGLGAIAGAVAGTLFVVAQLVTMSPEITPAVWSKQVGRLVPLAVLTGFIGGLTLDAVFRKLIGTNVVTDELLKALLDRAGTRPVQRS